MFHAVMDEKNSKYLNMGVLPHLPLISIAAKVEGGMLTIASEMNVCTWSL